jgi:hypothetical protein
MRGKRAKHLRRLAALAAPDNEETMYKVQRFEKPRRKTNPDGTPGIELLKMCHITLQHCQRRVYKQLKKSWKRGAIVV